MPQNILIKDPQYRQSLVDDAFGEIYKIQWDDSSMRAVLEPKKQPSRVAATLFPMQKTRFKYEIRFTKEGGVSHKDLLEVTFNRCNGATVPQQERIFQNRQDFSTIVKQMEQKIHMDQAQSNMMANAPSPAA